jgi:hypothetical protein
LFVSTRAAKKAPLKSNIAKMSDYEIDKIQSAAMTVQKSVLLHLMHLPFPPAIAASTLKNYFRPGHWAGREDGGAPKELKARFSQRRVCIGCFQQMPERIAPGARRSRSAPRSKGESRQRRCNLRGTQEICHLVDSFEARCQVAFDI